MSSWWVLNVKCPFLRITGDREAAVMRVAGTSLKRFSMTGSLGEWAGILRGRVADVLGGRTVGRGAPNLHERAGAMGALHERDAPCERAEVDALCERAGTLDKRTSERAAALHGRSGALDALCGSAALRERAEGVPCTRSLPWVFCM